MVLSLGAATLVRTAASLAVPQPRRVNSLVRAMASAPAPGNSRRRLQNVPGEFFVDRRCIDCATCRWMAPEVFKRVDGQSAVAAQPSSDEERTKALQALLSCPTASIHNEKPAKDILRVHNMFPLPIDDDLPGVYLCGYHSKDSYGATPYFITHPEGNIMVDSPRYTPKLVDTIEKLGGARYMFLTHIDDVADHRKWAERLKCERIIHSRDGSVCLLYKPLKALFTGDHVAKSEESDDLNLIRIYSRQSVGVQLDSMRKLLGLDFKWFLPGHGFRIRYNDVQAKNSAIESLLASYKS